MHSRDFCSPLERALSRIEQAVIHHFTDFAGWTDFPTAVTADNEQDHSSVDFPISQAAMHV
jgi:hypothetical protein